MSRQPSQQQQQQQSKPNLNSSNNNNNNRPSASLQQHDNLHRSFMNSNYLSVAAAMQQSLQQQQKLQPLPQQSKSNQSSRDIRQPIDFVNNNNNNPFNNNNNNNNSHLDSSHHASISSKKPSLLSGYHNPFSGTERNEIIPNLNPLNMTGPLSQSRYYSPNNTNESVEDKLNKPIRSNTNQMSILTNQPQRTNTTAPNFSSFSPAVLAAALGNPQLLQHHHQQLQQQFQQLPHNFPFSLNESSTNSTTNTTTTTTTTPSTTPSMIKKEPNIPQLIPTSIPAPSTTPGSSTTSSSSSTYVPQVEAISPTPEDQKENSNLQAVKEKICTEICKVEKDIASTQYQFDQLEKKQKEIKESQTKPIVDENEDKCKSSFITMTLAEKIYKENRVNIILKYYISLN